MLQSDPEQCKNSTLPFFCNATQLLCGDNSFVAGLEDKCVQVRDHDCAIGWRAYENIFGAALPNCTGFAKDRNLTFSKAPALVCDGESFDVYCGSFCLPSCKDFSQISTDATKAATYIIIILMIIGLLGGVLTLIVSIINRRKM